LRKKRKANEMPKKDHEIREKALYFVSKQVDYPLCPPRNVTLTLNYHCNQRCIMCDIKNHRFDREYEIDLPEITRIIDEMVDLEIADLVLTGGEPFLYRDIFQVIACAKSRKRRVIMITNGFYDDSLVRRIIDSDIDHLQISLDGSIDKIYEYIRGVKGSFEVVTDNIRKFTSSGKSVGATVTVVRQNYGDLITIARLAGDLGCTKLDVRPCHVSNADPLSRDFLNSPFWIPAGEIVMLRKVVNKLKEYNKETGFVEFSPGLDALVEYFEKGYLKNLRSCFIGYTRLIIAYNNKNSYEVWMCGGMAGDIRQKSLREIWYGDAAYALRKRIRACKKACLFPELHEPDLESIRTLRYSIRGAQENGTPQRINRRRLKNDEILGEITQVQFEVTNRCNLRCSICSRSLGRALPPPRDVSIEDFKEALDRLSGTFAIREINTQGLGEPLLCPGIGDLLTYAKSRGLKVWLVSNGTLLHGEMARTMVSSKIDKIRISIDTIDEELYSTIKQGSSLEKVLKNIETINALKKQLMTESPSIALNTVVLRNTLRDLENLIVTASKLAISEITLIPLVCFSKGLATRENQVDFHGTEFKEHYQLLKKKSSELGIELNLGISMETRETRYCHYGIFIDVEGFVHPCCNIAGKHFGNIYREDIKGIGERFIEFRNWLDSQHMTCKECNRAIDCEEPAQKEMLSRQ
jgi:MoaA/NifB/PqqE/SkfB family radical SAM enzyme